MQEIKEYVKQYKVELRSSIAELKIAPYFVIIQVGNVEASNRYVRNKIKDCEEVGIYSKLIKLPEETTQDKLLTLIKTLNTEPSVTAFMVQFPLPKHINEAAVMHAISKYKDADGFTPNGYVNPATPQGIVTYLKRQDYNFENKNAVIIGRSNIVGKPLARILLEKNCNVTVLHSKTSTLNIREFIRNADLLIVAAGKEGLVTSETLNYYYHDNLIVFDVGINFNTEGKLVGDCEKDLAVRFQSPVPGGVGLLTRLQLMENIYTLHLVNLVDNHKIS
jgi:methylenetetrahydrofolate dehydrogenase (NADP+) / methenyltetrahydrofolate cyclohydrolase